MAAASVLTHCAVCSFADSGTAFRFVQGQNASAFTWTEDGFGYAIAAQVGRTQLLAMAESVYRQAKSGG